MLHHPLSPSQIARRYGHTETASNPAMLQTSCLHPVDCGTMHAPRSPRQFAAAAAAVTASLVFAFSGATPRAAASPTAVAPFSIGTSTSDSSLSSSFSLEAEISKKSTVDATVSRTSSSISSSDCDTDKIQKNFDSNVKVQANMDSSNDTCTVKLKGMTLKQFKNDFNGGTIEHDDGEFTYTGDSSFEYYDKAEVSITFPGKVSRVSGDGTRSGNTATWKHVERETGSLEATGKDSPGLPWLWITIGVIAVILIGGGVILAIALTTRQKKRSLEPFGTGTVGPYSRPQMHPQMPQPGYAQPAHPGFPQPGVQGPPQPGPQQPGYTQPGAPQQPGPPNQPWPGQQSSPGAPY